MAVVVPPVPVPGQLLERPPVRTSLFQDCLQYRNLESFELALARIDAALRDPEARLHLDEELVMVGAKLHRRLLEVLASKDGCDLSDLGQDVASVLLDLTVASGAGQFAKALTAKSMVHIEVSGSPEASSMVRGHESQELLRMELDVSIEDGRTLAAGKGEKIPMMLWPASLLLAEVVLSNPALFRGQRVLELGAGCHGIVAAAASLAGASVLTTDLSWDAVEATKTNLRCFAAASPAVLGGCAEVQASILDWDHIEDCEHTCDGQQFPVVIGSDIVHTKDMAGLLIRTLRRLLVPGGCAYIAGADSRFRYGVQEFIEMMASDADFSMEIVPFPAGMSKQLEMSSLHSEVMTYSLYVIKKKTSQEV